MSRVNEILEDLFAEMARKGRYGAGFEKEFAGVEFTIQVEIKANLDRNNRKVIEEYKESNCTRVVMPVEKTGPEEAITYYISRDDINGLLIHELKPDFMEGERWISGGYSYSLKKEKPYIEHLDYIVSDMTEWVISRDKFLREIEQNTKNIMF